MTKCISQKTALSKEVVFLTPESHLPQTLINHWITLANSGISDIAEPLRQYGILYFLYVKRFKDGTQIELTNNILWNEHYYKNACYTRCPFNATKKMYDAGVFLCR